jgi:hypothetical protein
MANAIYEKSPVGRASVQWGGRPRPPTEMAARDGRPTNTLYFFIFRCVREEMTVRKKLRRAVIANAKSIFRSRHPSNPP